jgi:hypothetical protein
MSYVFTIFENRISYYGNERQHSKFMDKVPTSQPRKSENVVRQCSKKVARSATLTRAELLVFVRGNKQRHNI